MDYFLITRNIFAIIGAISTGHRSLRAYINWQNRRKEIKRKEVILKNSNYFLARVIHLGGNFSHTHSMEVYSNEEGGYYFNPPNDFVYISFNKGGDLMIVEPTQLSKKFGYILDSFGEDVNSLQKSTYPDICHLPRASLKNESIIKFIKTKT